MPKGLDSLAKDREIKGAVRAGGLQYLRLRGDAKIAQIRFITDKDDVEWAYIHRIPQTGRLGKSFWKSVYCSLQDGQECQYCKSEEDEIARAGKRIFFWVYVYRILHQKADEKIERKTAEYLGRIYYVESIDAPRILETGPGGGGAIEERLNNWVARFGTLCDRDYDWQRSGEKLETTYDLIPADKSVVPDKVKEATKGLKSLEEIIEEFKEKPQSDEEKIVEKKSEKSMEEQIDDIFGSSASETKSKVEEGKKRGRPAKPSEE